MQKRIVAYGIADSYNNPPTLMRDHKAPTSNSRRELEAQVATFNKRQGAKRYAVATVFEDGTFEASFVPTDVSDWKIGIVKWFSPLKGFGFVVTGDGEPDAFIHANVLETARIRELHPGDPVSIRIGKTVKGLVAVDIRRGEA